MAFGVHRLFRHPQAAWLTLVAGLALTAALGWGLHREAVEMDRQRLALRVAEVTAQLDARLEKSEMLLQNLRDYLMLSGENRNQVFARWCYENGLSINCPWLYGIAVATNRNEAHWKSQLPNPPQTWSVADREMFWALARRHVIDCEIALTSETKGGQQFLDDYGFQRLLRDVDQFALVAKESRVGMSEQRWVMLDANSNRLWGTMYFAPIYNPEVADLLGDDVSTRRTNTWFRWMHLTSVILAPVDFKALAQSVWEGVPADLGMELFSSTNQTATNWLNSSQGIPHAADPKFKTYLTHRQLWPMYGQVFSIFFYTTPLFEAQSPRRLASITIAAGTVLTLLATALVGVARRAHDRQERMTEQIREARDALAAAQQEREQFSHDLHDGTVQSLYAIQLTLDHTAEHLEADPANGRHKLSTVRRELDTVIAEIRQYINPETGAHKPVDFSAVLQALVRRARAGSTAQIVLHCDPEASARLISDQAVQLANITREALSNSLRHAKPHRVDIALRADGERVVLEISDDGTGFDPKSPGHSGVGLTSLPARARELGGTLDIQSSPGKGTRVVVRLPAPAAEPAEADWPADPTDES